MTSLKVKDEGQETVMKKVLYWTAVSIGGVTGWILIVILHYTSNGSGNELLPLFFVPGLAAGISYAIVDNPKHMGRRLATELGGLAGLMVAGPFVLVSSVLKAISQRSFLLGFMFIVFLGIGIILGNVATGQILGMLFRLYYRVRYGKKTRPHHRQGHRESQ